MRETKKVFNTKYDLGGSEGGLMRNWEFPPPKKKMEVKRAVFEKCKHSRGGGGGGGVS